MRACARLRGFVRTVMSTSWPSAVRSRIKRSLEKLAGCLLKSADTFGWPMPRQAILELIARPPQKCPHCRKQAAA